MSKIKYFSLTDNLQFYKFHSIRTYTMLLIGLVGIFIVSSCRSKKIPSIDPTSEIAHENEEAKTLSMSVDKAYLRGKEHAIHLTIKVMEKEHFARLENFKLKVEFLEELTWSNNGNNNNISYKNAAKQQQIARNINKALSEFIDLPTIGADSSKKQIRIPINLKINKQATKLRLGIELLDKEEQTLQKLEIVWRKDELLISNLNELIGEKIGSFILKNTTDIPLDSDKIELTLVNDDGIICQFLKTNTNTATLKQLLKDGEQLLVPDTETEPIELQIVNAFELKKSEIRLIVTQNPEKVCLATYKIKCKPTPSKTKASRQKASKNKKEEKDKFEDKEHAIPTESSKSTASETTNEEAKVAKGETKKEQSTSTTSEKVINNKNSKQKGKSKRKTENKKESKPATQQQAEPDPKAKEKEDKNKHTTTTALERDTEQEKILSHEEHISQPIDEKDLPIKEELIIPVNSISSKLQNEESQEKHPSYSSSQKDFTGPSEKKAEAKQQMEAQVEEAHVVQQQSEANKEEKDKNLTSKPNLHLNAEIKLKKNEQPAKMFNVSIENKGVRVSKETLDSVKLKYEVKGEGDLTGVKLKRRRNQGGTIISGTSIDNFLNSGLITGQKENFELIIETGDAKSLTIILFLEGAASANTATVYWKKEEKPRKKEKEPVLISKLEMNVELRNDETSEVITVWLENKGETLTKKALNNIKLRYTLAGTGEVSNAKLKKRKKNLVDAQGAKLGNLLDGGLEANDKKKFKLTIESAHADTLTIDLFLEGSENTSPVMTTWRKIAAT